MKRYKRLIYNVIYNFFCLFSNKTKICFIRCSTSKIYENIDILYKKLKYKKQCLLIDNKCNIFNIYKISISKIIITDQSSQILSNIQVNKKTYCIQLWHSSGLYKKIGFDTNLNKNESIKEKKRLSRIHRNIDYFIISDSKLKKYYSQAFNIDENKILPLGLVRTDKLFSYNNYKQQETIRKLLNCNSKKYLLYAPTYRTTIYGKRIHKNILDIKILKQQLGKNWCFLFRKHPSVLIKVPDGWYDVSDYKLEDILYISDVLVTDFSSIIFDYSFFKKPIYLFIPDIEDYIKNQNGIYISPENIVGDYYVCKSSKELCDKIVQKKNTEQNIWERFMSSCDGHSIERVLNLIDNIDKREIK